MVFATAALRGALAGLAGAAVTRVGLQAPPPPSLGLGCPTEAQARVPWFRASEPVLAGHLIFLLSAISARVSGRRPDSSLRATRGSCSNTGLPPEPLRWPVAHGSPVTAGLPQMEERGRSGSHAPRRLDLVPSERLESAAQHARLAWIAPFASHAGGA